MNDFSMIALFLLAWIAINRWILPAMGIQTCMSGGCCGGSCDVSPSRSASPEPGGDHDGESVTKGK